MIKIPPLIDVTDILDTDMIMVTQASGQTYKIVGSELNKRHKVIMADSTTVTGAPLKTGNCVRIYFTADITAVNATTTMQINYNNVNYYVKVPKNGALANYVAFNLGGSPAVFKYVQAYTTLELLFDGNQFIIMCNPVVISGTNFSIYADGLKRVDEVTENSMDLVTSDAVARQLAITTSSDSTPYSQRVNADKDKSVINKLIGASFAINQLVKNGNFANTSNWSSQVGTLTISNNVARVTYTEGSAYNQDLIQSMPNIVLGHKYYCSLEHRENSPNADNFVLNELYSNTTYFEFPKSENWTLVEKVFNPSSAVTNYQKRIAPRQSVANYGGSWFEVRNFYIIDLTQMFGSAIADRIYAMEQATAGSGITWIKSFGFFNKDYYSTDEGSIQSTKPSAYRTVGYNLVRDFTTIGNTSQYQSVLCADCNLRPYTRYCIGLKVQQTGLYLYFNEYLLKRVDGSNTFQTTGNYQYFIVETVGLNPQQLIGGLGWLIIKNGTASTLTFQITDVCISLADSRFDGQYEKYKGEWNYSLADTELRGVPKLDSSNNLYFDGDIYYPNGDVIRRYGVVDLGSLTWGRDIATEGTVTGRFVSAGISANTIPQSINSIMSNGFLAKAGASAMQDKCYRIDNSKNLIITDTAYTDATAFKTAMNGVYLVYELATPTIETVAGYTNPHTLIRKGAEEFVDNRTIPLPVGHETEYAKLPDWLGEKSRFI